jgi:hypothetical protein
MRASGAAGPIEPGWTRRSEIENAALRAYGHGAIDVPNHELMVDGDDVPGYMDAMSMPYSVPDERALKALTVGDIIRADIVVHGDDAHLENIKVTGHAKPKGQ